MIKLVFCLRRKPTLSREDFQAYWREIHAPLVAELWWDSWDALAANASNPAAAKASAELLEDERTFIDLESSPLWWCEEHEIVKPR